MRKVILVGLLGGLVILVIGMILSQAFHVLAPSIKAEFQNPNLFRSWSDPLMLLFFVHPFLTGIILAWVWSKGNGIVTGDTDVMRGVNYGLLIWLVATVPGMLISYSSFPISLLMIFSWTFNSLIELLAVGILFAKILK
jgi:hypothetical protein